MFFDGASPECKVVVGVGMVFFSPNNHLFLRFSLIEPYSNNVAEYNALLISLQLAREMGVQYLEAYVDSKLVTNRIKGEHEVHHEDLIPCYQVAIELANALDGFYVSHVSHL